MDSSADNSIPESKDARLRAVRGVSALWLRFIDAWLFAVLAAFVLIRVLGSQTAQHALGSLKHIHAP